MCTIKILILSNAPWSLSGYGTQAYLLGKKLREHGHEVAFTAFHGLQGPAQGFDGFPVFGASGEDAFARDVVPVHYKYFGADLLITLLDMWVLEPSQMQGMNVAYWMPVDCTPLSVRDREKLAQGGRPIALSRFGFRQLADAGFDPLYVPHSLDMQVWSPLENRAEGRESVGFDGRFVIGINAANQDPKRKAFYEQFRAFQRFASRHSDARMVVHTRVNTQQGAHLEAMLNHLGLRDKVAFANQEAVAAFLVPEAGMVQWHGLADLVSNCSFGEGFGLASLQAQATGTPVVVADCSASRELAGPGWKAAGQEWWNDGHDADWFVPFIGSIDDCYEAAYERRGDQQLRDEAREFALDYDADLVYSRYWEPALAELEQAKLPKPSAGPRRVFSPVMFRDELDMLDLRLAETEGLVDGHVIVEAPTTHRMVAKPLHFLDNAEHYQPYRDTIAHVVTDLDPHEDPWVLEHQQRDAAWQVIDKVATDDDIILITDVDEIPSRSLLERARRGELPEVCSVRMRVMLHAVDYEVPQELVPPQCVIATAGYIRRNGGSLAAVRDKRSAYPEVGDGGFHFSWLGGPAAAAAKLDTATCHTELLGSEEGNLIARGERWRTGQVGEGGLPVVPVEIDDSWPAYIRDGKAPADWFRPRLADRSSRSGSVPGPDLRAPTDACAR